MCGCSSGSVIATSGSANRHVTVPHAESNDPDCGVTREDLEALKTLLLGRKNPMNNSFVNAQLGLIETMFNYGRYCMYKIEPF